MQSSSPARANNVTIAGAIALPLAHDSAARQHAQKAEQRCDKSSRQKSRQKLEKGRRRSREALEGVEKSRSCCRRGRAGSRGRVDAGASVGRRGRDGLRGRVDDRQGGQHHLQSGGAQEGGRGRHARGGKEAPRGQGVGGAGGAGRRGPAPVARGLRPRQGQGRSRRRVSESFRVDGVDEHRRSLTQASFLEKRRNYSSAAKPEKRRRPNSD